MLTSPQEAFILGSGSSILNLTNEEKSYINNHPYVLGLNAFLLFSDIAGIMPKDMQLIDKGDQANIIFADTLNLSYKKKLEGKFYVRQSYVNRFFRRGSLKGRLGSFYRRLKLFKHNNIWLTSRSDKIVGLSLYNIRNPEECATYWATSLDMPLLQYYRASLSTAINLASIIYPVRKIKLIGVDLNRSRYFFEDEFKTYFKKRNHERVVKPYFNRAWDQDTHPTAITNHHGDPGIQAVIPYIQQHLVNNGQTLTNVNPESLLVQMGVTPYEPVMHTEHEQY